MSAFPTKLGALVENAKFLAGGTQSEAKEPKFAKHVQFEALLKDFEHFSEQHLTTSKNQEPAIELQDNEEGEFASEVCDDCTDFSEKLAQTKPPTNANIDAPRSSSQIDTIDTLIEVKDKPWAGDELVDEPQTKIDFLTPKRIDGEKRPSLEKPLVTATRDIAQTKPDDHILAMSRGDVDSATRETLDSVAGPPIVTGLTKTTDAFERYAQETQPTRAAQPITDISYSKPNFVENTEGLVPIASVDRHPPPIQKGDAAVRKDTLIQEPFDDVLPNGVESREAQPLFAWKGEGRENEMPHQITGSERAREAAVDRFSTVPPAVEGIPTQTRNAKGNFSVIPASRSHTGKDPEIALPDPRLKSTATVATTNEKQGVNLIEGRNVISSKGERELDPTEVRELKQANETKITDAPLPQVTKGDEGKRTVVLEPGNEIATSPRQAHNRPIVEGGPRSPIEAAGNFTTPPQNIQQTADKAIAPPAISTGGGEHSVPEFLLAQGQSSSSMSRPKILLTQPVAGSEPFARQITQQITALVQSGAERTVEVMLNPAELGKVRMSLTPSETGMIVTIQAERPETLDLLRRNADLLSQDLRDLGTGEATLSFSQSGGEHARDFVEPDALGTSAAEGDRTMPAESDDAAPTIVRLSESGRVDLRL